MPIDATTTSSSQQTSLCIHVKKLRLILEKRRAAKEANRKTRKNGDGENVGKRRSLKNVFDKPKLNRERIVDGGGGQFNDNSNIIVQIEIGQAGDFLDKLEKVKQLVVAWKKLTRLKSDELKKEKGS